MQGLLHKLPNEYNSFVFNVILSNQGFPGITICSYQLAYICKLNLHKGRIISQSDNVGQDFFPAHQIAGCQLFVTEGFHRVDPGGAPSRQETGEERDGGKEEGYSAEGQGVERADSI